MTAKSLFHLIIIILFSFILRFVWLGSFPPSIYTDEANQGYNAYSLYLTGKDEHGEYLPVSLRSFGDWKPPVNTYLMTPYVSLFGLNEWSIRLPSAILGTLSILTTYFLVRELIKLDLHNILPRRRPSLLRQGFKEQVGYLRGIWQRLPLLTSFFLAVSPWHLHQSRSAMLVMTALFFFQLGVLSLIKGFKKPKHFILASVSLTISIYAYYGMRLIVPLFLLFFIINQRKNIAVAKKQLLVSLMILILLHLPLFMAFLRHPNVIFGRARTVSVFYDKGVILRIWEFEREDKGRNPIITRFFHNKVHHYTLDIIRRLFSHLDIKFLFIKGDGASPFQIPNMGVLYFADALFLPLGVFLAVKRRYYFLLVWFIVSLLPAAFSFATPSHNRSFNAVFFFMVIVSMGILSILRHYQRCVPKIAAVVIITGLYSLNFNYYLKSYYRVLPKDYAFDWAYGFKEMVFLTNKEENKEKNIIVSGKGTGMAYIYFLFYNTYDPNRYHQEAKHNYNLDEFGFEFVDGFGRYYFDRFFNWQRQKDNLAKNTLYILSAKEAEDDQDYRYLVSYPNGEPAFKIFSR